MKRVYLAGPMRGLPDFNYPAFRFAAAKLRKAGWEVISPEEMDGAAPCPDPGSAACLRVYATRDARVLLQELRAEDGDAVAVLPGWQYSAGATAEVALACWLGLPIIDAIDGMEYPGLQAAWPKIRGWEALAAIPVEEVGQ